MCVRAVQASARLGAVAAQLLGARRVRLYQSCVFIKEPGMGDTNWHSGARAKAAGDADSPPLSRTRAYMRTHARK
jgi:hypothetical protein